MMNSRFFLVALIFLLSGNISHAWRNIIWIETIWVELDYGDKYLHTAIGADSVEEVKGALVDLDASIYTEFLGKPMYMYAVMYRQPKVAAFFARLPNINLRITSLKNETIFHMAAKQPNRCFLDFFLKANKRIEKSKRVDILAKNHKGLIAQQYAVKKLAKLKQALQEDPENEEQHLNDIAEIQTNINILDTYNTLKAQCIKAVQKNLRYFVPQMHKLPHDLLGEVIDFNIRYSSKEIINP